MIILYTGQIRIECDTTKEAVNLIVEARAKGVRVDQEDQRHEGRGRPSVLTNEQIELIGTDSDAALARNWNVSTATVRNARIKAGINTYTWKPPDPDLLGKQTDESLAVQWCVGTDKVRTSRISMGVKSFVQPPPADTTSNRDKIIELAPTAPMAEIARAVGVSRERVRQVLAHAKVKSVLRWHRTKKPCPDPSRLGKTFDKDLAMEWGVSAQMVTMWRNEREIDQFQVPHLIDHDLVLSLVASMSDRSVAEKVGCSISTVIRIRAQAGVPSYRRQQRSDKGKVAAQTRWSKIRRKMGND